MQIDRHPEGCASHATPVRACGLHVTAWRVHASTSSRERSPGLLKDFIWNSLSLNDTSINYISKPPAMTFALTFESFDSLRKVAGCIGIQQPTKLPGYPYGLGGKRTTPRKDNQT
jgi:hypothetical protein